MCEISPGSDDRRPQLPDLAASRASFEAASGLSQPSSPALGRGFAPFGGHGLSGDHSLRSHSSFPTTKPRRLTSADREQGDKMRSGGKEPPNKSYQEDPVPKLQSITQPRGDL